MLLALALSVGLAAAPDTSAVVLVGRRTSVTPADANALSQAVSLHLVAAGVPLTLDADAARAGLVKVGLKDSAGCAGRKACLVELAQQLGVAHAVVVSLSQVGSDLSLALELVRVSDASALERDGVILPPKTSLTAELIQGFTARVRARLAPSPAAPPPPVDAPVVVKPLEVPAVAPVVVVAPPPPPPLVEPAPRSHATQLVLGGAGVVALGVAAALLASGLSVRAEATQTTVVDGVRLSPLKASEALEKANASNLQLGLAGGFGAVGLGLGGAAVLTW